MDGVNIIIGIIMILSFVGLAVYCIKGMNLMVGFFVMSVFWTVLALIGNALSPVAAMEGKSIIDVLTYVFADGPAGYAQSILVNGRVLRTGADGDGDRCDADPQGG